MDSFQKENKKIWKKKNNFGHNELCPAPIVRQSKEFSESAIVTRTPPPISCAYYND